MISEMIPYEWMNAEAEHWVVEFIMSIETTLECQRELLLEWASIAGVEEAHIEEVIERWQP